MEPIQLNDAERILLAKYLEQVRLGEEAKKTIQIIVTGITIRTGRDGKFSIAPDLGSLIPVGEEPTNAS